MKHNKSELFRERYTAVKSAWEWLARVKRVNSEYFTLNRMLLENAVDHYVDDLNVLKIRYMTGDAVQPQKISGLTAGSILRFRPVVPIDGACNEKRIGGDTSNEMLAVYQGMVMCAVHYVRNYGANYNAMSEFLKTARCKDWVNKYVYLLRERNYTTEALIMIFEGFCLANFPEAIEKELKDIRSKNKDKKK